MMRGVSQPIEVDERPYRSCEDSSRTSLRLIVDFLRIFCADATDLPYLNHLAAVLLGMHDDTLDPVNEFERTVAAVLQRLRGLAPAAIENGVGG
jgi:hypothetical protein